MTAMWARMLLATKHFPTASMIRIKLSTHRATLTKVQSSRHQGKGRRTLLLYSILLSCRDVARTGQEIRHKCVPPFSAVASKGPILLFPYGSS